jgi:hypothetical protein
VLVLTGRPLGSNPYSGEHAREATPRPLEVRAPGFNPRTLELSLERDVDLEVRLSETETPRAPASEKKSAAPTARTVQSPEQRRAPQPKSSAAPVRKRHKPGAPALDTSDPWSAE